MPPRGSTAAGAKAMPGRKGHVPPALTAEYVESLKLYADLLFKGGLTPKGVSRPEQLAARIAVGRDLGISDTQAIANIMIVGGRPSVWGDLGWAMIRASGLLEDVETFYEGDPDTDAYTAVCKVKRVGAKREYVARFSIGDARNANLLNKPGPWQEYRDRQLMWRAKGFASRDEFPDVLCGLIFTEELLDTPGVRVVETETVRTESSGSATSPSIGVVEKVQQLEQVPPAVRADSPAADIDAVFSLGSAPGLPDASDASGGMKVEVSSGKLSDAQLERLVELRAAVIVRRGIADDEEAIDKMWLGTLADYDVESARDLTGEQARELIADIEKALAATPVEPGEKPDPKARRKRPEPVSAL